MLCGPGECRVAKANTAPLGGSKRVFGALRNHLAFMLRDGGKNMHRQLIGVRIIHRDKLNARFH